MLSQKNTDLSIFFDFFLLEINRKFFFYYSEMDAKTKKDLLN